MAGNHVRSRAARQVVHRERRRHRPALPQSFEALNGMLEGYAPMANSYLTQVNAGEAGEAVAYIFGTDYMVQNLGAAEEWHIDGTFQVIKYIYLYSIKILMVELIIN